MHSFLLSWETEGNANTNAVDRFISSLAPELAKYQASSFSEGLDTMGRLFSMHPFLFKQCQVCPKAKRPFRERDGSDKF